jgi:hypothetical protein
MIDITKSHCSVTSTAVNMIAPSGCRLCLSGMVSYTPVTWHHTNLLLGPLTFISSSKNDLLTVYDVLQDESGMTRIDAPSYSLLSCSPEDGHCVDSTLVRHPLEQDNDSAVLIRLSDRGSIHRLDFTLSGTEQSPGEIHIWPTELDQLEKKNDRLQPTYGHLSERTFNEIDLEPVISRKSRSILFLARTRTYLFLEGIFPVDQDGHENGGEAMYATLDEMRSFWATLDEPITHMLTM